MCFMLLSITSVPQTCPEGPPSYGIKDSCSYNLFFFFFDTLRGGCVLWTSLLKSKLSSKSHALLTTQSNMLEQKLCNSKKNK